MKEEVRLKSKLLGQKFISEIYVNRHPIRKAIFCVILVLLWRVNVCGFGKAFLAAFIAYCASGGWRALLPCVQVLLKDISLLSRYVLSLLVVQVKSVLAAVGSNSLEKRIAAVKATLRNHAYDAESMKSSNAIRPFSAIPGPRPSLPFIGTNWQYLFGAFYSLSDLHTANIDKYHLYGPVVREEFRWRRPMVHLYNPEDIETMFREQGTKPIRPINEFARYYRLKKPEKYESPGLSNLVGEEWHRLRKTLAPVLLRLNSTGGLLPEMNKISDDFVHLLRHERHQETFVVDNIQKLLYRLSLEAIYMMCLEERLGCLEPDLQPNTLAFSLISSVKLLFEAFQELYFGLPLWKYFPTKAYRKLDEAESTIYEAASNRVQEAMENLKNEAEAEDEDENPKEEERIQPSILRKLLRTKNLSEKEIKATIIDFLSGGIFTVANAFSFLLYHISRNPSVQEKLYEQLQEVAPDGEITAGSLSKLDYLKACIKESFRLTPIIPGITRILSTDIIASGYHIPAGTPVFSNFMVACKRRDIFPEPDEYRPERWLEPDGQKIHPFALVPFGFGSRMCVGRRFAEMEMYTALAKVVHNFRLRSTGEAISCKQDFIVVPSGPVSVIFEDR